MKKNENSKKRLKTVIIICIVLIFLLFLLLILLKSQTNKQDQTIVAETETITAEEQEEMFTDYIRTKPEKERMQTYIAEFMRHIEVGEYSSAYQRLHSDFKERFFQTENKFIRYVKENYSDLISLEFKNIERQGKYYILTVQVNNLEGSQTSITQKYIIQENGLNDYYISFQVQF